MNLLKIWYCWLLSMTLFSLRFVHSKPQHLSLRLLGCWTQNVMNCIVQIKTVICGIYAKKQGIVVRHIKRNVTYACFKV